ncbi:alpha/beta-hydrolase [Polychaeton citri CBS 116435]|uniref:Alpha/beta-hydrolase n=1 Tax=Polychaeton citri CBS 116435 TaxID=1314669 RepID=A0A9P4Q2K5_9PEZI|nr:alpha/beta-hydrolase [Polychaeton citri CBS 116435]
MLVLHRTALRRRLLQPCVTLPLPCASFHTYRRLKKSPDPRIKDLGHIIEDEYAAVRTDYQTPKQPIVLAHGLLGFDELHLAGQNLPGIRYWRGITEALSAKGVEVITAAVPPSGSIEARAAALAKVVEQRAQGKAVNIVAGLDARYMISRLKPPGVRVLSLTTIATPHRGSAFADFIFSLFGTSNIPKVYRALEFFGLETGAFSQLTRKYMAESFNPRTPDNPDVSYYSYGAAMQPHLLSVFRQSGAIVELEEGANDGLVSVESSRWGEYKGTLKDVSHLDTINWTNRLRWWFWGLTGNKRKFNAIALYLDIADMLAKQGL